MKRLALMLSRLLDGAHRAADPLMIETNPARFRFNHHDGPTRGRAQLLGVRWRILLSVVPIGNQRLILDVRLFLLIGLGELVEALRIVYRAGIRHGGILLCRQNRSNRWCFVCHNHSLRRLENVVAETL